MTSINWRAMGQDDLAGVTAVSDAVLGGYSEPVKVYAERLALYPAGCLVLGGEAISGYLIAHPWPAGRTVPLNHRIDAIPPDAAGFYLHDLALLPTARGRGAAQAGVALVEAMARASGADLLALVAVNGADAFWQRQGFIDCGAAGTGYGNEARYMQRHL